MSRYVSRTLRVVVFGLFVAGAPASGLTVPVPLLDRSADVEGVLEGRLVVPLESEPPGEDPRGRLRLDVGLDLTERTRFEGLLVGEAGGSPKDAKGTGFGNWHQSVQDYSPRVDLDEAYVDAFFRSVDLRFGIQKFAWGRLDGNQPNDLLNPDRLSDPVLDGEDEKKIGVPAVGATWYLPANLNLEGAWVPIVVPARFPDEDERWYPPLARVPEESRSSGFVVRNQARFRNGDVPARTLRNGSAAVRLGGTLDALDYDVYYFEGFDPSASLEADARGFARLNPASPQGFDVRSEVEIFPVFDRIRSVGLDVVSTHLGFTLRGEAAWIQGRLFPRAVRDVVARQRIGLPDLLLTLQEAEVDVDLPPVNVERDAVEWGLGGEVLRGNTFLLLQMNQTTVLDNRQDLLVSDHETRFTLNLRHTFWGERMEAEIIGVYAMQSVVGLAIGQVTWRAADGVELRGGHLTIAGHEESFLGQFRDHDQLFVRARLLF